MSTELFDEMKRSAIEGEKDPLLVYAELKEIEAGLKQALDEVFEVAIEESEKYEKSFDLKGWKFERRNGKVNYSFKHIPQWVDLKSKVDHFEEISKQALKMNGKIQTATKDGEEIPLPRVTYSKDSLIVKKIE